MSLGQPIWDSRLTGLLVRIPLAIYFLIVGYVTIQNMHTFVEAVNQLHFLPGKLSMLYAAVLPYLELTVGGLLLIGLWTNLAAVLSAIMIITFILPIGFFPYPAIPELPNKDIILFFVSLSLLANGPGCFSVDGQKGAE